MQKGRSRQFPQGNVRIPIYQLIFSLLVLFYFACLLLFFDTLMVLCTRFVMDHKF